MLDNDKLLRVIFDSFTTKFNWAYYDGYEESQIGRLGFGFSLILLSKYGHEKRADTFYAQKYLSAFPRLLDSISPSFGTLEHYATSCYSLRTFRRFMDFFGLINLDTPLRFNSNRHLTKSDLFDRLITCTPPMLNAQ